MEGQKGSGGEEESRFYEWLHQHKVRTTHAKIAQFPDTGRGMQATKSIEGGEVIFSVPYELFMTEETANRSGLKEVFAARPDLQSDDRVALHILYERKLASSDPSASFWAPYLPFLPSEYSHSLFFSYQEMRFMQGSNLYLLTKTLKKQVRSDYEKIFRTASKSKNLFNRYPQIFDEESFSLQRYKWALATIWSRSFDLEIDGKKVRALPPFADLFNHSVTAKSKHAFDPETRSLVCTTLDSFKEGQEIVFNYGAFSNAKLLRLYGFTIPNNPFDCVDLWAPMSPQAPFFEEKLKLLKAQGISNDQSFELVSGNINPNLLTALRIQRLSDPSQFTLFAKAKASAELIVNSENEQLVLDTLIEALKGMLEGYPSTLSDDIKAMMQDKKKEKVLGDRERFILHLQVGEKKILLNNIQLLERKKDALPNSKN